MSQLFNTHAHQQINSPRKQWCWYISVGHGEEIIKIDRQCYKIQHIFRTLNSHLATSYPTVGNSTTMVLKLQGRDVDSWWAWAGNSWIKHTMTVLMWLSVKIIEKTVEKIQAVGIPKPICSFVLFLFFITAGFGCVNSQQVCAVVVFCEFPGFAYSSVCKEKGGNHLW